MGRNGLIYGDLRFSLFGNRCSRTVILSVRGNKSKYVILSVTEQIRCRCLLTEQVRCQRFMTERIRCFFKNTRLTEQVGCRS